MSRPDIDELLTLGRPKLAMLREQQTRAEAPSTQTEYFVGQWELLLARARQDLGHAASLFRLSIPAPRYLETIVRFEVDLIAPVFPHGEIRVTYRRGDPFEVDGVSWYPACHQQTGEILYRVPGWRRTEGSVSRSHEDGWLQTPDLSIALAAAEASHEQYQRLAAEATTRALILSEYGRQVAAATEEFLERLNTAQQPEEIIPCA